MTEAAPQRRHALREVFNGVRWLVRAGAPWRMLPNDLPPWSVVSQQTQRWLKAGVCEALGHDVRTVLRVAGGRQGSKGPRAVDTLGHLFARPSTPVNEQDRAQVKTIARQVQAVTGERVTLACVDQGYTGAQPAQEAAAVGIRLEVVKLATAKHGFVLLPRRWVVERSFGWMARFRRLARAYERLPATLAGLHFLTFATLMLKRIVALIC